MRSKKRIKLKSRIIQDLVIGAILGFLAFSIGDWARASDMEDFVNSKIKEEFIKVDGEDLRASVELPTPEENLQAVHESPRPMDQHDPALQKVTPVGLGEQVGVGELPRAGVANKIDPTDPFEQRIADKQAYELYRENYRRAVQKEFIRKLHNAGWDTTRNIAEEIKAKEALSPGFLNTD